MTRMRLVLPALVVVVASGCATQTAPIPDATPAPPQRVHLGWDEPFPADKPRLVFRVDSFAVTGDGWRASIEIANETDISWTIGDEGEAAERQFGIMLFATGTLDEVDRRNSSGSLPAIRRASEYSPPLPSTLGPGESWSGDISARGALAAGRFVRVTFGVLKAVGTPPDGVPEQVVWITDSSYKLRRSPLPQDDPEASLESARLQITAAPQWRSSRRNAATTPRTATIPTATSTA
jgi:hypothetical protein